MDGWDVEAPAVAAAEKAPPEGDDGLKPFDDAAPRSPSGSGKALNRTSTYLEFEVHVNLLAGHVTSSSCALCPQHAECTYCMSSDVAAGGGAVQGRMEGVPVLAVLDILPVRGGGRRGRVPGVGVLRLVGEPAGRRH